MTFAHAWHRLRRVSARDLPVVASVRAAGQAWTLYERLLPGSNGLRPSTLRPLGLIHPAVHRPDFPARFKEKFGGDAEAIIKKAEAACRLIFDLLGSGPVPFKEKIPWHQDFKSGHAW